MKAGMVVRGRTYGPSTSLIHGADSSKGWNYSDPIHPPVGQVNAFRLRSVAEGFGRFCSFGNPANELSAEPSGYIYERLRAPGKDQLQERLRMMEQAKAAFVFATGMAAISGTFLAVLDGRRDHAVIRDSMIYGCSHDLFTTNFPFLNMDVQTADTSNLDEVESKIDADGHTTRVIFFESPANPGLKIVDMPALRQLVDRYNDRRAPEDRILLVTDNTFATPYSQCPLLLGADIVASSMTKNLNGFGTDMGGMSAFNEVDLFYTAMARVIKNFGGVLSDRAAWDFIVYSLATFMDRMEKKNNSAMRIARFLENHPKVGNGHVVYPGLESFSQYELAQRQMSTGLAGKFAPGDMIYFQLAPLDGEGDDALLTRTMRFLDYIASQSYVMTLAVSLGTQKTLIECPELMTHSCFSKEALAQAKLLRAGIRFSIGAEDPADLESDLDEALSVAK